METLTQRYLVKSWQLGSRVYKRNKEKWDTVPGSTDKGPRSEEETLWEKAPKSKPSVPHLSLGYSPSMPGTLTALRSSAVKNNLQ